MATMPITLTCRRCDGKGRNSMWQPDNGTCFECAGAKRTSKLIPLRFLPGMRIAPVRLFLWTPEGKPCLVTGYFPNGDQKSITRCEINTPWRMLNYTGQQARDAWNRAIQAGAMASHSEDTRTLTRWEEQEQEELEAEQEDNRNYCPDCGSRETHYECEELEDTGS